MRAATSLAEADRQIRRSIIGLVILALMAAAALVFAWVVSGWLTSVLGMEGTTARVLVLFAVLGFDHYLLGPVVKLGLLGLLRAIRARRAKR